MDVVIGLDFGNINSYPAYIAGIDEKTNRGGAEVCLVPAKDRNGIPTTFHFRKAKKAGGADEYAYGAKAASATPVGNQRNMLKRRLGTEETIDGKVIRYDEVITAMIKHIVDRANVELERNHHVRTNKISLAYPVVFEIDRKERLRQLAEQAVLEDGRKVEVVGMIREPAAAALEYIASLPAVRREKDVTVLVYDLGGGTFDASVITAHQNAQGAIERYEVLDQSGGERAGNEFTTAMENLMRRKLQALHVQLPAGDGARKRFECDAEALKIQLSDPEEELVRYEMDDGTEIEITRAELEKETEGIVGETIAIAKRLYDRSPVKPEMIIMTGGQSQMPIIRKRLESQFAAIGKKNIIFHKPQQAVAFGAARFGKILEGGSSPQLTAQTILRTGRMLGLSRVVDEGSTAQYVCELIPRNTRIPMTEPVTHVFHPTTPTKKHTIHLAEALKDEPDIYNEHDFRPVATLTIDFGIAKPAKLDFVVSVYIDAADKIHFSASDPNGQFKTVDVVADYANRKGGRL